MKIQPKLALNATNDAYEQEAEQVAERVMGLFVPRDRHGGASGADKDSPGQGHGSQEVGNVHTNAARASASPGVNRVLSSAGRPLEYATRAFMEPRFGHDFGSVRVHADDRAAESARTIGALAYTFGRQIVFDAGAYRPGTVAGQRLLAHELTHVVQQGGAGRTDEGARHRIEKASPRIQRYASPTGFSNPRALIPITDFIGYVEAVERGYPGDTPEEILTRIRTQYYSGFAFESLIPGAPYLQVVGTRTVYSRQMGDVYEVPITRARRLEESAIGTGAFEHLTARADENALGDNPSPYIVMPNGNRIDVGHLLLGLDALLHPRVGAPFTNYGVPNIDPASWVADLGIASVWMTEHEESGSPHGDVVNPPSTSDLITYYNKSAPVEDLLADVDSFGLHAQWRATPGQRLSQVIRGYYLGTGSTSLQRRFQIFCSANGLSYTRSGNAITWDPATRASLIARIDRFSDLYAAGSWGAGWTMVTNGRPTRRTWPHTPAIVDRFLAWVKTNLETELAASSGP